MQFIYKFCITQQQRHPLWTLVTPHYTLFGNTVDTYFGDRNSVEGRNLCEHSVTAAIQQ